MRVFPQEEFTLYRLTSSWPWLLLPVLCQSPGTSQGQQVSTPKATGTASSGSDSDSTNAANNPTTLKFTINLYNYAMPNVLDRGGRNANQAIFRVSEPFKAFGVQQIIRLNVPVVTVPSAENLASTGTSNLQLYDILLWKVHGADVGGGPLIDAPTASSQLFGTSRWQAGFDAVLIAPQKWGLLGGLFNYQHSFTGNTGPAAESVTFQTLIHYNFPHKYYFRSTGVWSFDYASGSHFIPLGFGAGKAIARANGDVINFYLEPQYSVDQAGIGTPKWQIFTGLTLQFASRKHPPAQ